MYSLTIAPRAMKAEQARCPFCDIPLLSYIDHDYDQGIFVEYDACPECSFKEVEEFVQMKPDLIAAKRELEHELGQPIIASWYHNNGWVWLATEQVDDDLYFGFVTSPLRPEGEWGYFSKEELHQVAAVRER